MDRNELPLIKRSMENAEAFEKVGDTANAEKWLLLGEKAEKYYEKQDWKMAEDFYHIYDEFQEK
jgi:hypothetical protein